MSKKTIWFMIVGGCLVCVLLVVFLVGQDQEVGQSQRIQANNEDIDPAREDNMKDAISIVDSHTGTTARVGPNSRMLTATDKDGKTKWSVDVIAECEVPVVGSPVIRHLSVDGQKFKAVFGKHSFASIDIETGNVVFLGSD